MSDARKPSTQEEVARKRSVFEVEIEKRVQHVSSNEKPFVPQHITNCQVEKLTALFEQYFDLDHDGHLTESDVVSLNEKILEFTQWPRRGEKALRLIDFHNDLFSCLLVEANRDVLLDENKTTKISLNAWLKLWDHAMRKSLALAHLPQWVQVLPMTLFTFIDYAGEGRIDRTKLTEFYEEFMKLKPEVATVVGDRAYNEMTGNGDYQLDRDLYTTVFSNFLFGKSFFGPGKYVLGTFEECIKPKEFRVEY